MEKRKTIMVLQQDARLQAAACALEQAGWWIADETQAPQTSVWVLPLPLSAERPGLAELLQQASPGTLILGGRIAPSVYDLPRAKGVELVDYYARPELVELNAIPTAEGCIAMLMANSKRTLWQQKILLIGFGRVARALAVRLAALGAQVTVAARDPAQRAFAKGLGCEAVPLEQLNHLTDYSTVVNTVPAMLLDESRLEKLPQGSLIVDLASKPGGTDFAAAKRLGYTALHALGLPGKCAPETAGQFIADTILQILQERSEQL